MFGNTSDSSRTLGLCLESQVRRASRACRCSRRAVPPMSMNRRVWMYLAGLAVASLGLTSLLFKQFGSGVTTGAQLLALASVFQEVVGVDPGQGLQSEENQHLPSCSLRAGISSAGWQFNFSVPVFQWNASFSQSEWDRLSGIHPPYGWHGVPYDDVHGALELLPGVCGSAFERSSKECVSCAVVGNGGILRGSKQGSNIDKHTHVFRVNGAITAGFEEDVGNRTSFYGFTTNTMKNSLRAYSRYGFKQTPQSPEVKYVFIPSQMRDYVMLRAAMLRTPIPHGKDVRDRPSRYFGPKPAAEKFRMLHPDFITYIVQRFLKSHLLKTKFSQLYMPSTGALMLFTAIHTCDKVSAYGFITGNYASFSEHYYDDHKRPLKFFANHDLKMEARLWKSLHTQGVITLYQRD
ncbi:alpha-N-acetylgalactosaminide alpha-2,6-sialyltransferase 2-like [Engraulis encrasicolus]|uniref:alpha-N-acetylgalactosaminide alpha-2,6-sialyltransferase 2-like n=1 Tax=Engraulis encrasicolus TaxID=184585 RepID=UPI002FD5176F